MGSSTRRRRPSPAAMAGVLLLVLGLSCLGWVAYQYVGTGILARRAFAAGRQDLRTQWQQPGPASGSATPAAARPGEGTALLRVPAFGADYEVPILEGTDLDTLARGIGHYPGTAAPGEVGNYALAGHRVTHGAPFFRLLELQRGDLVVVETASAVHTYSIAEPPRNLTVAASAAWVLDPVPGEPGTEPTRELITLTTGQDLLRSPDRSVGFGHLLSTRNK